jgi:hypothetical protein
VTIAEAFFGLGDYRKAGEWLRLEPPGTFSLKLSGNVRRKPAIQWMKNQRSWFVSRARHAANASRQSLMSKHRVLRLKPHLRLEWRGQHGLDETQEPDHFASLGDSIASSTRIRFSVHTG